MNDNINNEENQPKLEIQNENDKNNDDDEEKQKLMVDLAQAMFQSAGSYLRSELTTSSEEFKLLEQLNKQALSKYTDMTGDAKNLVEHMEVLKSKYEELGPSLSSIDIMLKGLEDLEHTVGILDEYTKNLETKITNLKK
eukprot:TRINITY_DN7658_c0_g1_i1.p1 TRINITY_DN7658_c0_g1~~TRINITY_DN7658_c0_g1_i1.p1  ORF type:complete len:139 (-),score=67.36 TRINITY_DN7658_c0_g1_i1:28-444(-)